MYLTVLGLWMEKDPVSNIIWRYLLPCFSQQSVELRCLYKYMSIATMWNLNCEKKTRRPWNADKWVGKGMCDEWKNVLVVKDLGWSLYIFGSATDVLGCPAQVTYRINRIYLFVRFFFSSLYLLRQIYLLFICLNISENFTHSVPLVK